MKPHMIYIPKGGVPERVILPPDDNDTCRNLRMWFFVVVGTGYISLMVSWLAGWREFNPQVATFLGIISIMIPIMGDWMIRPGKLRTCWVTLTVICFCLIPFGGFFFLVLLPLGLLTKQFFKNRSTRESIKE